jgi:hypothetical protein
MNGTSDLEQNAFDKLIAQCRTKVPGPKTAVQRKALSSLTCTPITTG